MQLTMKNRPVPPDLLARTSPETRHQRDLKNSLGTSFAEGEQLGIEKGRHQKSLQVAENCLLRGLTVAEAAEIAGLDPAEVAQIAQRLGL
jgi:predicted transposase YdaD